MSPNTILELLNDNSIAAKERLDEALASKAIPTSVLLQFACDCASKALDAEQEEKPVASLPIARRIMREL